MARPKLTIKRDTQLNLRLTRPEYDLVKSRANAFGLRPIDYGRAVLLDEKRAPTTLISAPTSTIDRLWLMQLQRLGNNLNQLVRHCHTFQAPPPASLEPLLRQVRQVLERAHSR